MSETTPNDDPSHFATTQWTRVLASQDDSSEGRQALSDLCATYYAPVVSFLRREGRGEDEARELAHEFFARVLQGKSFGGANPHRGRFRSYLLGALKHFLANRRAGELCEKRGAGATHVPLPLETSLECTISAESTAGAEMAFDRDWATSVLEHALSRLKTESQQNGAGAEYETLKGWLTGEAASRSQVEAADRLGMSDGALRVAIHRLRKRFRELVRTQVANTVDDPGEISAEMNHLIRALS